MSCLRSDRRRPRYCNFGDTGTDDSTPSVVQRGEGWPLFHLRSWHLVSPSTMSMSGGTNDVHQFDYSCHNQNVTGRVEQLL